MIERERERMLLASSGNDRSNANVVRAISSRPHNDLFDLSDPDPDCVKETLQVCSFRDRTYMYLYGHEVIFGNF